MCTIIRVRHVFLYKKYFYVARLEKNILTLSGSVGDLFREISPHNFDYHARALAFKALEYHPSLV